MTEIKPGFRQSTEESLVDSANLLAELVADEIKSESIANGYFSNAVKGFQNRKLNAEIWSMKKKNPGIDIYITDAKGIVLFDSTGKNTGRDFSRWNDVYLTLHGKYGVRSTLADPDDKFSSVMHVAAPIKDGNAIIGVITLSKPNANLTPFIRAAQNNLSRKGGILLFISLLAGVVLSFWLTRSIRQLADYANAVKRGKQIDPPNVQGKELKALSTAMVEMKTELEGKQYIEHYVQTLTHQLKTPIAAIKGAAELLGEDMNGSRRQKFIENIASESDRLEQIVQRLLTLSAVENRNRLESVERINIKILLDESVASLYSARANKSLTIDNRCSDDSFIYGERFLLQQALTNLLDNAIGFSPEKSRIVIDCVQFLDNLTITIIDQGDGVPDYAINRLFERFYSLPRPGNGIKGNGLGLCFVKEIARLHGGDIAIENITPRGARAALTLKIDP